MFFKTSGNKAETSFPKVIDMMVFWIDSFLRRSKQSVKVIGHIRTFPMHIESCQSHNISQLILFKSQMESPYTKPARSSNVSPFLGAASAPLILLTAMLRLLLSEAATSAPRLRYDFKPQVALEGPRQLDPLFCASVWNTASGILVRRFEVGMNYHDHRKMGSHKQLVLI